jgi:hypothetical protein
VLAYALDVQRLLPAMGRNVVISLLTPMLTALGIVMS